MQTTTPLPLLAPSPNTPMALLMPPPLPPMALPLQLPPPPPTPPPPPPASIYVGDLDCRVTGGDLLTRFASVGGLLNVRVCVDVVSRLSLGYGYVNYLSRDHAAKAIEKLNNTLLYGKPIRVMWSHRDPDARKSGIGNVFVKNLHEAIDNVKLRDLFSKFGNILSCKVAVSFDGMSKGFGFVQFESQASATSAIENLNGTVVEGKEIYVGNFIKKSDRILIGPDSKFTNLYVKNFDSDVTEELLVEKFSKFGKIANIVIARDANGISKGFGFVNFENSDDAKKAMETMNGAELGSKNLYVGRAQKRAERLQILRHEFEEKRNEIAEKYKDSNLYVKNLDDSVSDDELGEHFSKFGTIVSLKLMRDEKGIKKGFGFVSFSSAAEANKAKRSLHGSMFHGKPLYVAIAQRKEDRQAQLQVRLAQRMNSFPEFSNATGRPGFHPLFYRPPGVVPQLAQRPCLMFHPPGMRPAWTTGGFSAPTQPPFQHMPTMVPNTPRHPRPHREIMNGHVLPQAYRSVFPLPHMQQAALASNSFKDSPSSQQGGGGQIRYGTNGRSHGTRSGGTASQAREPETLSSMLAAASLEKQKQILGEHLLPLVKKHKFELASKITGMLLEMDNSELLLLLESPESLAAKVEEAEQVLKVSRAKVESIGGDGSTDNAFLSSSSFLPAEIAAN